MSLGMKSSSGKVSLQFAKDLNLWVVIVWLSLITNLACISLKGCEAEEDHKGNLDKITFQYLKMLDISFIYPSFISVEILALKS